MKILVKGFGNLEKAIGDTLREQFNVLDYSLVNASQAYAVIDYGKTKMGAAFHLDIEDQSLYLIGDTEDNLSKGDTKRLNMMPLEFLKNLTSGPGANLSWRENSEKYHNNHKKHIFRGAIMTSENPPDVFDHGSIASFIVTHPASKSAFDLDGYSVEVPQYLRGFYKVKSVPTLDIANMREGIKSAESATRIMLTNLSIIHRDIELTARYLDLPPTPPIVVISEAKDLTPVAMSKEPATFKAINSWGKDHNKKIGVDRSFITNNSENVRHFINDSKAGKIKNDLKSSNKLQDFRRPAI